MCPTNLGQLNNDAMYTQNILGTSNPANFHRFSREQSFDSKYTKLWAREKSRVLKIQSQGEGEDFGV